MARKNGSKNESGSTLTFNSQTKAVMADVAQDNIKEKVNSVREVVSGRSNNEIILVLQFYDYDVEKTIQAYVEDRAQEALQEWRHSGNKPVKKRRNKKKNSSSQPVDVPMSPESISSESGSAASFLINGDVSNGHVMNGELEHETDAIRSSKTTLNGPTTYTYQTPSFSDPTLSYSALPAGSTNHYDVSLPNSTLMGDQSWSSSNQSKSETKQLDSTESKVKDMSKDKSGSKVKDNMGAKEKSPSPQPQRQHHQGHHHNRQRAHSGSHSHAADSRDRTVSTSSTDGKSGKKHAHLGLEKSTKDLHRQTVSLERLRLIFNEEVDRSYKRIKSVFDEIRTCLNAREALLMEEVNTLKEVGGSTFNMRQDLAHDLKVKIDRAERMNEAELAELRVEIKHFVTDRKVDEDLSKTTRFMYDDQLKQDIGVFGEVVPVKCQYIQRLGSTFSVASTPTVSEPDHHISKPGLGPDHHISKPDIDPAITTDTDKKSPIAHLDPEEAHEMAELQRRLKHSLTLEGIPVQTYPERPSTAPVPSSSTSTTRPDTESRTADSARRNNRNRRRNDRDRRPRPEGQGDDNRITINQAPNGERVILIGRKTGPAGGQGGRPPRGGRGRGRGGSGRGRGGNPDGGRGGNTDRDYARDNQKADTGQENRGQDSNAAPKNPVPSPKRQQPLREGSGSPRRGMGRGRGQGNSRRGNSNPGGPAVSNATANHGPNPKEAGKQDG